MPLRYGLKMTIIFLSDCKLNMIYGNQKNSFFSLSDGNSGNLVVT